MNRYVYGLNNPIVFIDISGFSAQEGRFEHNMFNSSDLKNNFLISTPYAQSTPAFVINESESLGRQSLTYVEETTCYGILVCKTEKKGYTESGVSYKESTWAIGAMIGIGKEKQKVISLLDKEIVTGTEFFLTPGFNVEAYGFELEIQGKTKPSGFLTGDFDNQSIIKVSLPFGLSKGSIIQEDKIYTEVSYGYSILPKVGFPLFEIRRTSK